MSRYYGDLELVKGKLINVLIDPVESLPPFDPNQASRLLFDTEHKSLILNDGESYKTLQFSSSGSDPLKVSLGSNWLNKDLTFNPVPFNELENISGLTADSSLFNVIAQLDAGITLAISTKKANYLVSELPSASDLGSGSTAFALDATLSLAAGIGTVVVGGGTNKVPLYSDGTSWLIG